MTEEKSRRRDPDTEIAGDGSWTFSGDNDGAGAGSPGFFYCGERKDSILSEFGWSLLPEIAGGSQPLEPGETSGLSSAPAPENQSPPRPPPPRSGGDPPETTNKVTKKGTKRVRQPRFAFMTKSEIDLLEDGYRWRKYGQKTVKNSPFPRSYYRCTNSKCMVKKLIQRSPEDPTIVITTYEGQHCHHGTVAFPRSGLSVHHATTSLMEQPSPVLVPNLDFPVMPLHGKQPMVPSQLVQSPLKEHYDEALPDLIMPPLPSNEGLLDDIMQSTMRNA